jgi:hypothetical protein
MLMLSAEAPAVIFNDEELARLRELRQAFLRSHGIAPRQSEQQEDRSVCIVFEK